MPIASDAQLKAAADRGRRMLRTEPRAAAAQYDRKTGCIVIGLTDGSLCTVSARSVQDLQSATDEAPARIEIDGQGFNLHWPALDVDLFVPALVSGVFGTRAWSSGQG